MQKTQQKNLDHEEIKPILSEKSEIDFSYKITLLGEGAVGKTSIRKRFLGEGYKQYYLATIGADFSVKRFNINDNPLQFQIWDIAGQPRFKEVRKSYFLGSDAGVFVHNVTRPQTLQAFPQWMNEFWKNTGRGPVPIIVLSNKMDLIDTVNNINLQAVKRYFTEVNSKALRNYGIPIHWLQTSAKIGIGIDEAFMTLARQLMPASSKQLVKNVMQE